MTHRTKQAALLSMVIALLGLLLLAASISDLQFRAGTPFPGSTQDGPADGPDTLHLQVAPKALSTMEIVLGTLLLLGAAYLLARLVGLASVRNIAWVVLAAAILVALFSILPAIPTGEPSATPDDSPAPAIDSSPIYLVSPLGKTPAEFIQIAAAGLLIGMGLVALHSWKQAKAASRATGALGHEAESALHALANGQEFSNIIIRCYMRMMEVLRSERSFQRQEQMTVREFQDWLESNGIPPRPIQELSSLFEKARYSKEEIDASDEERGVDCLKKIVQYCQQAKVGN
jgi:hypothetical protein